MQFIIVCQINSFAVYYTETHSDYLIYDTAQTIDFSGITYVQEPNCGYSYYAENTFNYSGGSAPVWVTDENISVPSLTIYSSDSADDTTNTGYDITVESSISILSTDQPEAYRSFTGTDYDITITVKVLDACSASSAVFVADGTHSTTMATSSVDVQALSTEEVLFPTLNWVSTTNSGADTPDSCIFDIDSTAYAISDPTIQDGRTWADQLGISMSKDTATPSITLTKDDGTYDNWVGEESILEIVLTQTISFSARDGSSSGTTTQTNTLTLTLTEDPC